MFITRFAPSPTGDLHLGNLRTCYFNWLLARSSGGKFILRIDDTDLNRNVDNVNVIFDILDWLGLNFDMLAYQSDRFDRYKDLANGLVNAGLAQKLDNGAICLNGNITLPISWLDQVVGDVSITQNDLDYVQNLVLIKSNGTPTYNWSCVIDDVDFGVNYVCRGSDHISNTVKQLAIYNILNAPMPKFAHVGLLHFNKKKLSKRDSISSVLDFKSKGFNPDAILNFILRLGWGPTVDDKTRKTITKDDAISLFISGGKMRAPSANIDINLLDAYDRKYKARI